MRFFDPIFTGSKSASEESFIVLPDSGPKGIVFSPHLYNLSKEQNSAAEKPESFIETEPPSFQKFLDIAEISKPKNYSGTLQRKEKKLFREIRKMISIGMIFFLFLSAGNAFGKVQSLEMKTLPGEITKVKSAALSVQENLRAKAMEKTLDSLNQLSDKLEASSFFFREYAEENPENAVGLIGGAEISTSLLEAANLLSESGAIALKEKISLEQKFPLLLLGQVNLLEALNEIASQGDVIHEKVQKARKLLKNVNGGTLPVSVHEKLQEIDPIFAEFEEVYGAFQEKVPALRKILGDKHPHTILFLLQNRNEIRATGGFIGNTLTVVINQGKIYSWKMTDIFEYSGQSTVEVPVPKEFAHLTGGWFIHDCNREPDFPSAAETCRWFLEHSRGETPDTIVAVHQDFLTDILALTGPITLPNTENIELTSGNVSFVLSYLIEAKILGQGGENSPKKFLEDLLPVLIGRIKNIQPRDLLPLATKWSREKYFQAYSRDEDIEDLWNSLDVSGKFLPEDANADFLGVVQENVGGNKSDAFITQNISEESLINLSGEMYHTVKVTRHHNWGDAQEQEFNDLFAIFGSPHLDKETLRQIMGAAPNKVYTSVSFPKGSKLLSAKNISLEKVDTTETDTATTFAFFFPDVAAGEAQDVELFVSAPPSMNLKSGKVLRFFAPVQAGSGEQYFSKKFVAETGIQIRGEEISEQRFQENISAVYLIQNQ